MVRPIRSDELPMLLSLYEHLHARDESRSPEATEHAWAEAMGNPRCRYFGGFHGGRLVSSCTIMVIPNLTRGCRPYAVLENVVTDSEYRNRGWGKAVLSDALHFAWSSGCYKVMLMTGRQEDSVFAFYEGAGFSRHDKQAFIARRPA